MTKDEMKDKYVDFVNGISKILDLRLQRKEKKSLIND